MITVTNLSLAFSGSNLFKDVNLKFVPGNCYGIIGANGAGKSTFLRILSGELEPSTGEVIIPENTRMSVLKQDHFAFNEYSVLDTIIMGNRRLYDCMKEKDALYMKEDFSDEDGERASELEGEFAEVGGQAVLGRQSPRATPWLTERHGYDPTLRRDEGKRCPLHERGFLR